MVARTNVYNEVHAERERAHTKHVAHANSREDARWTNAEWLPILAEELGEVAHEMTYDARYRDIAAGMADDEAEESRKRRLRKELVQVAAMATAWIDAIDRER